MHRPVAGLTQSQDKKINCMLLVLHRVLCVSSHVTVPSIVLHISVALNVFLVFNTRKSGLLVVVMR
jgi:hypothetical protein